ncbi:hypothetical protein [uncultured Gammaproteobacteria bacterium]|nr:hypothetical protein [uncultured Gammaproteobacteria bacterium]
MNLGCFCQDSPPHRWLRKHPSFFCGILPNSPPHRWLRKIHKRLTVL